MYSILTLFLIAACNKDLTDQTDITQFTWEVKSLTIDNEKINTPSKTVFGNKITNTDAYVLSFENDNTLYLNLSVNDGQSTYVNLGNGLIDINGLGTTKMCCNNQFDESIIDVMSTLIEYKVLGKHLFLIGTDGEIELKKR